MRLYRSRLLPDKPNKKEYTFLSRGSVGVVRKVVEPERMYQNIFNVLLADETKGKRMDDTNLTGNNHAIKVISTVVRVIEKFFADFPGNGVFIPGNTPAKKRMYQRKVYFMRKSKYIVLANLKDKGPFKPVQRPVNRGPVYNALLIPPS